MNSPPIFKLPLELKWTVSGLAGLASESALAVTCKALYGSLPITMTGPCTNSRQRTHRIRFLSLLERDLPNKYLCLRCTKLHEWSAAWKNDNQWKGTSTECCPVDGEINVLPMCLFARDFVCKHPGGDITFDIGDMRLVMSRHMFGREHGLPVKVLNRTRVCRHVESGIRVESTWRPLAFEDKILMKTTHETQGSLKNLREFFLSDKASSLDLCCSMTMEPMAWLLDRLNGIHKAELLILPPWRSYQYSKRITCWACNTDVDIDIMLRETVGESVHGSVNVSTFSYFNLDQVHHGDGSGHSRMEPLVTIRQQMSPYLRQGMGITDLGREQRRKVQRSLQDYDVMPSDNYFFDLPSTTDPNYDPFEIWPARLGHATWLWYSAMSRYMSR